MPWQTPKTNWSAEDGVRDADFNRIEGNILELYNKGVGLSGIVIYVSPAGNDTTGDGRDVAPFRTISKALSVLPKNLNGQTIAISVSNGTYDEAVIIKGFSNGILTIQSPYGSTATINSLEVNSSICEIKTLSIRTVSGGIVVTNGAVLLCTGSITVDGVERGLYVNNGSTCRIYSQLNISNAALYAVHVTGASTAYILSLAGTDNEVAIIAEEGSIAAYGNTNITTVMASFVTRSGGRILTGGA